MYFFKVRLMQFLLSIQVLSVIDVSYLRTIFDFVEQTPVLQKAVQGMPNKSIRFDIEHGKIGNIFVTYSVRPNAYERCDRVMIFFRLNGMWRCYKNHPLPVYQKASGEYNFSLAERESFEHSFHTIFKEEGVETGSLEFTQNAYTPHPDGRILNGSISDYANPKNNAIRFRVICDQATNRWLLHFGPGEPLPLEEALRRFRKINGL